MMGQLMPQTKVSKTKMVHWREESVCMVCDSKMAKVMVGPYFGDGLHAPHGRLCGAVGIHGVAAQGLESFKSALEFMQFLDPLCHMRQVLTQHV
jgi:hypothetical protein